MPRRVISTVASPWIRVVLAGMDARPRGDLVWTRGDPGDLLVNLMLWLFPFRTMYRKKWFCMPIYYIILTGSMKCLK